MVAPIPARHEGRIANVSYVGRDAVDAMALCATGGQGGFSRERPERVKTSNA